MTREKLVMAGCTPLPAGAQHYLEEAYAVLIVLSCALADGCGSKPVDSIAQRAVEAAATLVALGFAEIDQ